MHEKTSQRGVVLTLTLVGALYGLLTGCSLSPQVVTALETDLGQLRSNRALLEASVRELNAVTAGSKRTTQISNEYEDLREVYNKYLDQLASAATHGYAADSEFSEVSHSARAYFVHAGTMLGATSRDVSVIKAEDVLTIPQDLPGLLNRIPKPQRRALIKQFNADAALPAWRNIH